MAKKAKPAKAAHLAHDRVVAFIDILGFQDLVERKMPKDKVFYQWMQDTFKELEDQHVAMAEGLVDRMDIFPSNPALQMAHFSDSIVFTSDMEIPDEGPYGPQKAADRVVVMTIMAVIDLFRRGILVRGGIASGWTVHHSYKNVLFGQGVIEAYKLEKQAHVPRVLISDDVVRLLGKTAKMRVREDVDGYRYINMFGSTEPLRTAEKRIRDWLKEFEDRPDILPKYRWLAGLYNKLLVEWKERSITNGAKSIILHSDELVPFLPPPVPPTRHFSVGSPGDAQAGSAGKQAGIASAKSGGKAKQSS